MSGAIATHEADDVLFSFGASLDSEMYLIGDMSGRKERSEGNGVEISLRTWIKGTKWRRSRRRRRRRTNGSLQMKVGKWYIIRTNDF